MEISVVSISRTLGAGGEEVGRPVADELSFRYVDEEVVVRASAQAGVSPATIAQTEHSQSLSERIREGPHPGRSGFPRWLRTLLYRVHPSKTTRVNSL